MAEPQKTETQLAFEEDKKVLERLNPPTSAKPPSSVTIYAPDGSPHTVAPIDAREILASDAGYTSEPPKRVTGAHVIAESLAQAKELEVKRGPGRPANATLNK